MSFLDDLRTKRDEMAAAAAKEQAKEAAKQAVEDARYVDAAKGALQRALARLGLGELAVGEGERGGPQHVVFPLTQDDLPPLIASVHTGKAEARRSIVLYQAVDPAESTPLNEAIYGWLLGLVE
jgi:hypothetical protein